MKLVIISGRSGSGKSTALKVLEDTGFYCIDNLPAGLLPALVEQSRKQDREYDLLAVCIDARNHTDEIRSLANIRQELPKDVETQIVYLDANSPILIKRFSETRRKHPLSGKSVSLSEAISKEKQLLEPIASIADLQINTNNMNVHALRDLIKQRLCNAIETGGMSVLFKSFGFKNGIPIDADIVYDVRCLPNPYWEPSLRHLTGKDPKIKEYLSTQDEVQEMFDDIRHYLERWLPAFRSNNRSYLTVAIGCTGGMHRSVYISEKLKHHFSQTGTDNFQISHRDLLE